MTRHDAHQRPEEEEEEVLRMRENRITSTMYALRSRQSEEVAWKISFRKKKKKKGKEKKENKGARSELARLTGSWRKRSSNRAYPLQVRRTTRKPLDIGRTSKRAKPFQALFPLPRSVQGSIRRWPSDVYVATCFLFLRSSWRN